MHFSRSSINLHRQSIINIKPNIAFLCQHLSLLTNLRLKSEVSLLVDNLHLFLLQRLGEEFIGTVDVASFKFRFWVDLRNKSTLVFFILFFQLCFFILHPQALIDEAINDVAARLNLVPYGEVRRIRIDNRMCIFFRLPIFLADLKLPSRSLQLMLVKEPLLHTPMPILQGINYFLRVVIDLRVVLGQGLGLLLVELVLLLVLFFLFVDLVELQESVLDWRLFLLENVVAGVLLVEGLLAFGVELLHVVFG